MNALQTSLQHSLPQPRQSTFVIIEKIQKKINKILKQTISKHGIKSPGICKSKCLTLIKQSKNQVSKPSCMLAFKQQKRRFYTKGRSIPSTPRTRTWNCEPMVKWVMGNFCLSLYFFWQLYVFCCECVSIFNKGIQYLFQHVQNTSGFYRLH